MKLFKSSLVGAAALALASLAMATTPTTTQVTNAAHVYITGSTAFRGAAMTGITNILDAGYAYAYDSSSLTGCNYAVVYGTLASNHTTAVTIKAYWSGSASGQKTLDQNLSVAYWMPDTVTLDNTAHATTTYTAVSHTADITMMDTAQSLSPYNTTALTANKVGVIVFAFVKGRLASGHPALTSFNGITNINGQQAQAMLTNGVNMAQLTGNSADNGYKAYALGRSPDSGTRLTTFAETGYGTTSTAIQVEPTTDTLGTVASTATGQTIQDVIYYPAGTVNGIYAVDGDNGFASGGGLADVLSNQVSATSSNDVDGVPYGLIGYLGVNDASRSIKGSNGTGSTDVSRILSYNGVSLNPSYSTTTQAVTWDNTQVAEGKYTFWSYEYLAYRPTLSGTPLTVAGALATRITNYDASVSGLILSAMHCSRAVEGGVVTHN